MCLPTGELARITHVEVENGETVITVDANHDLAGHTLMFNIDLVHLVPDVGVRPESERKGRSLMDNF